MTRTKSNSNYGCGNLATCKRWILNWQTVPGSRYFKKSVRVGFLMRRNETQKLNRIMERLSTSSMYVNTYLHKVSKHLHTNWTGRPERREFWEKQAAFLGKRCHWSFSARLQPCSQRRRLWQIRHRKWYYNFLSINRVQWKLPELRLPSLFSFRRAPVLRNYFLNNIK